MGNTNNFPTDITITILLSLPRKSILRFKCVCESWHSLIEDAPFMKHHYYLNQILKALKKDGDFSIDDPIIDPPSVINHQLSMKFMNSSINGFFLLAVPLPDKIVFWNPEDLSESAWVSRPILNTRSFALGERIYFIKPSIIPFVATSWEKMDYLEVCSMRKEESYLWKKMLEIEEPGPLFLKKSKGNSRGFLFSRSDKNGYVVYDDSARKLKEVADGIMESKRKLKEFRISGPQVSLFINRTYAEALISPDSNIQV